jgi:NADPH:quinone reductase-like Zn-dependent oxidoreductase
VFRYPSTIPPEAAATIPLASITAALGLFYEMGLPLPPTTCEIPVLVWAGSTSVGQYAIQLAKSAGCFVITTASPVRHAYLKELGADVCFDYKDPNVVSQIKQAAKDSLAYAIDCISEKDSTKQVCATLTGKNSQVVTVLPVISSDIPSHVKERRVMMYTIFGRDMHVFGQDHKAKPQDKEFAEKYYKLLSDVLLPNGLVKANKVTNMPGGLNGVEDGFKKMMENKVAAEKLVYTVAETMKQ